MTTEAQWVEAAVAAAPAPSAATLEAVYDLLGCPPPAPGHAASPPAGENGQVGATAGDEPDVMSGTDSDHGSSGKRGQDDR